MIFVPAFINCIERVNTEIVQAISGFFIASFANWEIFGVVGSVDAESVGEFPDWGKYVQWKSLPASTTMDKRQETASTAENEVVLTLSKSKWQHPPFVSQKNR